MHDMTGYKTIDHLPDRIGELTNLVELDLRGQQLTELPESLCYLPNLKRLYLPDNQLATLPARFSRLQQLVCLEVRNNPSNAGRLASEQCRLSTSTKTAYGKPTPVNTSYTCRKTTKGPMKFGKKPCVGDCICRDYQEIIARPDYTDFGPLGL